MPSLPVLALTAVFLTALPLVAEVPRHPKFGFPVYTNAPSGRQLAGQHKPADNPAYSPWFQGGNEGATVWTGDYNNDPVKGQGYEGAVAYAVAAKLGFTADEVVWIHTTFDNSYAPGAKSFDLYLAQVSIKPERAEAVDFSSGYYDAAQGVVTIEGSPIAGATSIADLKTATVHRCAKAHKRSAISGSREGGMTRRS